MAKRSEAKTPAVQGSHVKFRFSDGERYMDFEMSGGTEEIASGFKSLAVALAQSEPTAKRLPSAKPPLSSDKVLEAEDDEEAESESELVADGAESVSTSASQAKGTKRYSPKAPQFLSALDLTKADVQLADFIAEKAPVDMTDKYAVVACWYKQHFAIDEVSADHIYTAAKFLGWHSQLPEDVGSPLRSLKSARHWFDKGIEKGHYKINWSGENAINKMKTKVSE